MASDMQRSPFLSPIEPPKHLRERVLGGLRAAQLRRARLEFWLLSCFSFVSTLMLVPALRYAAGEFYTSGFYDYLRLAFADHSALGAWSDIGYSLLESLPSIALLLVLALTLALGWSLRRALVQGRIAFGALPSFN